MKILLTNDDGIHAEGMRILMDWARTLGEVTVAAPKLEQSGKSHAIQILKPFEVNRVDMGHGIIGYSVDSTPADCVRFAILGLHEHFDLVISGVNRGLNIGRDIIYSGTVAAVFEAAALNTKGIAFSTQPESFDTARTQLPRVWEYICKHDLLQHGDIYNINIPHPTDGKIYLTHQGGPYYSDDFLPIGNDMYRPMGKSIYEEGNNPALDTDVTLHGGISISPLTVDRTDWKVFQTLTCQ